MTKYLPPCIADNAYCERTREDDSGLCDACAEQKEQDTEVARLRSLLDEAVAALRHQVAANHQHSPNMCDGCVEAEATLSHIMATA